MVWFWGILLVIAAVPMIYFASRADGKAALRRAGMEDSGIDPTDVAVYGAPNPVLICPHCHTQGKVLTKQITKKNGISGAKATGAILTGGVSILATGLSQKDAATQAHCVQCKSTWHI